MPKKASSKAKTKTSTAKKPAISSRKKVSELNFQQRLSTFLSSVRSNRPNVSAPVLPGVQRKYVLPLLGVVVVLVVLWLASRYLVVAWVDKKPITRFTYYDQLDKKYGKDMKEQLIVQSLIDSEAQKRGISASDQEISDEIKKIEDEQGGADQLNQVLQMQGISQDELKNLVRLQILRQKMFANDAQVTDAEVADYITQNKASLPETNPNDASAEANLKNNVREQLKQQKLNATFSSWLQENLNGDRVIRL